MERRLAAAASLDVDAGATGTARGELLGAAATRVRPVRGLLDGTRILVSAGRRTRLLVR